MESMLDLAISSTVVALVQAHSHKKLTGLARRLKSVMSDPPRPLELALVGIVAHFLGKLGVLLAANTSVPV